MTAKKTTRSTARPTGAALLKAVTTGHKRRPAIALGQHVRTLPVAGGLTHGPAWRRDQSTSSQCPHGAEPMRSLARHIQ